MEFAAAMLKLLDVFSPQTLDAGLTFTRPILRVDGCHRRGVKLALDDFGTSYASFSGMIASDK